MEITVPSYVLLGFIIARIWDIYGICVYTHVYIYIYILGGRLMVKNMCSFYLLAYPSRGFLMPAWIFRRRRC